MFKAGQYVDIHTAKGWHGDYVVTAFYPEQKEVLVKRPSTGNYIHAKAKSVRIHRRVHKSKLESLVRALFAAHQEIEKGNDPNLDVAAQRTTRTLERFLREEIIYLEDMDAVERARTKLNVAPDTTLLNWLWSTP